MFLRNFGRNCRCRRACGLGCSLLTWRFPLRLGRLSLLKTSAGLSTSTSALVSALAGGRKGLYLSSNSCVGRAGLSARRRENSRHRRCRSDACSGTETAGTKGVAAGVLTDVAERSGKASRRLGVGPATRRCTPGRTESCCLSASMYLTQPR